MFEENHPRDREDALEGVEAEDRGPRWAITTVIATRSEEGLNADVVSRVQGKVKDAKGEKPAGLGNQVNCRRRKPRS